MTVLTADAIAHAVVAACREEGSGEDPIRVVEGAPGLRARAYAAFALERVFPHIARPVIARVCGASSYEVYMAGIDYRRKHGQCQWWDDAVLERVVEAVRRSMGAQRDLVLVTERAIRSRATVAQAYAALRQVSSITVRREPAPAHLCADVTAELMGDPPPSRSALAEKTRCAS